MMHCGQTGAPAVGNCTTNITVIFSGFLRKQRIADGSGEAIAGETQRPGTGYGRVQFGGKHGTEAVRHAAQGRGTGERPEPENG